jgi:SAM-dependent MidA family methyltransferase
MRSSTPSAVDAIATEIDSAGPIRFDRFMELALYGSDGYYDRPPIGAGASGGDFVTSPHVHPVFAQLLAESIRDLHEALGAPETFDLVEVGAGDGTLLRGLLPELADLPLRATAVERSPGARAALARIDEVAVRDSLPAADRPTVLLAHELLDNLPFRRLRATDEGIQEIHVGHEHGRFVEVLVASPPGFELPPGSRPGGETVLPVGAVRFLLDAFAGDDVDHGPRALLAIDYGTDRGAGGPVHGYAAHRVVEDVLASPGSTDITAGIDFGMLADAARDRGLQAFPTVSQREALLGLGFEAWLRTELERQQDLLATGRGAEAVATWGGRSRASLLVDPAGLGRFRWFVVTTAGIPEPVWLRSARERGDRRDDDR